MAEKSDEEPDDEGLMCWGEGEDCTEPEVGIFMECCEGLTCVQDYSGGEDGSIGIKPVCMAEKPDEVPDDEEPDDEPEEDDEEPDDEGLMCWGEGEDCTEPEVGIFQECCEGLICVQDYTDSENGSIGIQQVCMPEKPDEAPEGDDEEPDDEGLMCYAEGESCNRNEPGIYRDCCDGLECKYDWFSWESTCTLKGEVKPDELMCIPEGESCNRNEPGIYMDCCKGSTCTYKYVPNWWGGVSLKALCA